MNPNTPSIIQADRSVLIHPLSQIITWQRFLQASRAASSEASGWNSKTHWVERGLELLVNLPTLAVSGFVAEWTQNSFAPKAAPLPRLCDFRLGERLTALEARRRGATDRPRNSEDQLNWDLATALHEAEPRNAKCVTYELPLAREKKGLLKSDIVVFDTSGSVEIIELKIASGENPLMGLVEAICYAIQLVRCWPALQPELQERISTPNVIRTINLVVAGEAEYWKQCTPAKRPLKKSETRGLYALVGDVSRHLPRDMPLTLTLAEYRKAPRINLVDAGLPGSLPPPPGSFVQPRKPV